ncbi:MAG: helix-hairpin-helix domain-containing protein [Anaerolineaceae bacterium]|nr:helix-hairpin-helix domain-containing protein [Anaerolineaceae bacterium]
MENVLTEKVNINKAENETLQLLPGVGPRLAERILAGRPYYDLEDMTRVNGVSMTMIEDWRNLVKVTMDQPDEDFETPANNIKLQESVEEPTPIAEMPISESIPPQAKPEEAQELSIVPEEKLDAQEISEADDQPISTRETSSENINREQVIWYLLLAMVVTFVLTAALTLGLLAVINQGQLRFASPAEVIVLNTEVQSINNRLDTQLQDITALRERVENLETLSDRMIDAENAIGDLQSETSTLSTQVSTIEESMLAVEADVEELQTQTQTFTTFFQSMRDLFLQFFPAMEVTE